MDSGNQNSSTRVGMPGTLPTELSFPVGVFFRHINHYQPVWPGPYIDLPICVFQTSGLQARTTISGFGHDVNLSIYHLFCLSKIESCSIALAGLELNIETRLASNSFPEIHLFPPLHVGTKGTRCLLKTLYVVPIVVVHASNPSSLGGTGRQISECLRPAWITYWFSYHLALCNK